MSHSGALPREIRDDARPVDVVLAADAIYTLGATAAFLRKLQAIAEKSKNFVALLCVEERPSTPEMVDGIKLRGWGVKEVYKTSSDDVRRAHDSLRTSRCHVTDLRGANAHGAYRLYELSPPALVQDHGDGAKAPGDAMPKVGPIELREKVRLRF